MPKDKPGIIIIRKGRRHEDHGHGGSWKVAYADFVTALMAFFLLLWLVSMVKPETKAGVAEYFESYNLFQSQPGPASTRVSSVGGVSAVDSTQKPAKGHELRWSAGNALSTREIKNKIDQALTLELGQERDRVILEEYSEGLRIHLVDKQGQPSFHSGDPELTEEGMRALQAVERAIRFVPNKLAIEGHTDAAVMARDGMDNWSLAVARAEHARQHLISWGFDQKRLVHVAGYANTAPLIVGAPLDARNRRVSILIYNSQAAMPVSSIGIGNDRILQQPAGSATPDTAARPMQSPAASDPVM